MILTLSARAVASKDIPFLPPLPYILPNNAANREDTATRVKLVVLSRSVCLIALCNNIKKRKIDRRGELHFVTADSESTGRAICVIIAVADVAVVAVAAPVVVAVAVAVVVVVAVVAVIAAAPFSVLITVIGV